MLKSKKGVSPLIATIILIGFSVALGAVVMNWGNASLEFGECTEVSLKPTIVNNQEKVCYSGLGDEGSVSFIIEDQAASDIDSIRVWVIGENNLISVTDVTSIKKGYPISGKVPYDFETLGAIEQVQFIPLLNQGDKPLLCMGKALVIDEPAKC